MLRLMLTPAAVEPFGFFTWDSLRAGWYLTWRLLLRVSPILVIGGVALAVFGLKSPIAGFLFSLGVLVAAVWSIALVPKLTSQWAQERYGQALEGGLAVWWGITWRSMVVSLVAAAIMAVPSVVAVSLRTAYPSSALGLVGSLLAWLLNLVNIAVTVLATGWAMSRVAASQVVGVEPVPASLPPPMARAVDEARAAVEAAPAPSSASRPAPRAAPASVPAATAVSAGGKMQCPKCGLYETERGSVIGWYCKVCGWRESRR
jgi:hypothetical protein